MRRVTRYWGLASIMALAMAIGLMAWIRLDLFRPARVDATKSKNDQKMRDDGVTQKSSERARNLVLALAGEQYGPVVESFDRLMRGSLSAEGLESIWNSLVQQCGAFQKITAVHIVELPGEHVRADVHCEFARQSMNVQVGFNSQHQVSSLRISGLPVPYETPSYADTGAFVEHEVVAGTIKWPLAGTLTLPKQGKPCPAVVLVHGSGPHDRDESVGACKPFRDLAWGLASRGIAVLRYDKRTFVYKDELQQMMNRMTVQEEVIDDAIAAVSQLRRHPDIDGDRIYIVGHSIGGSLAARIGLAEPKIAGAVILAGNVSPLHVLMVKQAEYLHAVANGTLGPETLDAIRAQASAIERLREPNADAAKDTLLLGASPSYWLDLLSSDTLATARKYTKPLLILQGDRDYQVGTGEFYQWNAALASRSQVTFRLYQDLNHLFVSGKGQSTPQEYNSPGHVADTVIADICEWIHSKGGGICE